MTQVVRRSTKYTNDVLNIVRSKQHATNAEIAHEWRKVHAEVSDTTVHRVTQRHRQKRAVCDMTATQNCMIISCVVIVVTCETLQSLTRCGVKLRVN